MLLAAFAIAVKRTLDFTFGAGGYRLFGRVGYGATATGTNVFYHQRLIARILKAERYFQFLPFGYFTIFFRLLYPLYRGKIAAVYRFGNHACLGRGSMGVFLAALLAGRKAEGGGRHETDESHNPVFFTNVRIALFLFKSHFVHLFVFQQLFMNVVQDAVDKLAAVVRREFFRLENQTRGLYTAGGG